MSFLLVHIVLSALFLLVLWWALRVGSEVLVLFVSAGATFLSLGLGAVLAVQTVLTFIATLICMVARAKEKTVLLACLICCLLAYAAGFAAAFTTHSTFVALRDEYPVVSLSQRLSWHEHDSAATDSASQPEHSESAPYSQIVQNRLEARDNQEWIELHPPMNFRRRETLARLHDTSSSDFALANGFGVGRMNVHRLRGLEDLKNETLPELPMLSKPPDATSSTLTDHSPDSAVETPSRLDLIDVHDSGTNDFFDRNRMGVVQSIERVVGFVPHRFTMIPSSDEVSDEWLITRLELVSLLRHETPRVYVSDELPQMEKLNDAPTRPLNPFEASAIPKLQTEQDLVIEEGVNRIRMVGSLRAAKQCTTCHNVKRGTLLGAFSYDLHRKKPVPEVDKPTT